MTKKEAKSGLVHIQKLKTLFGPKGERWVKRSYRIPDKLMKDGTHAAAYCLVGGIEHVDGPGEGCVKNIIKDIVSKEGYMTIEGWNDHGATSFKDVQKIIKKTERKLNSVLVK